MKQEKCSKKFCKGIGINVIVPLYFGLLPEMESGNLMKEKIEKCSMD